MKGRRSEKLKWREDHLTVEECHHRGIWYLVGGNSYEKNIEKAIFYFKKNQSHSDSKWFLNIIENHKSDFKNSNDLRGWYVAGMLSNEPEKLELLKKSSDAGYSYGQMEEAIILYTNGNKDDIELIEKSAKQNNPEGLYWLAHFYDYGKDVEQNRERAQCLYMKSSKLYFNLSTERLGIMFFKGEGVVKDLKQATKLLVKVFEYRGTWLFDLIGEIRREHFGETDYMYILGEAMYWYIHNIETWASFLNYHYNNQKFALTCFDYYCDTIDSVQNGVFTFLICCKRSGIQKDVCQIIARKIWNKRDEAI